MVFTTLTFLQGLLSLIFVTISYLIGLKIISRYFQKREKTFLLVGIAWIGLADPWFPDAINFILILILMPSGTLVLPPLGPELSLIIGYGILPFFLFCWLIAFTDLLYEAKQKLILTIYSVVIIIFEFVFFFIIFTDYEQLGRYITPFQIRWELLMQLFLMSFVIVALITGILFARVSLRAKKPRVNLKGKFILAAFLSFTIGAVIESLLELSELTVIITRAILISSSIEFYLGFIMPRKIENFFLKS